jgi:nucleoside-diphosphate-sugar epimerase
MTGPEPARRETILVTGGAGKAGRHVVAALAALDNVDCRVLDHAPLTASDSVTSLVGDIRDDAVLDEAASGCSALVHLAAIPRPGLVADDVVFDVNVNGTYKVMTAAVRAGLSRVVLVSSSAVIGTDWCKQPVEPEYLPFDERHPNRPQDVYGLSKLAGEEIAATFQRAHSLQTVVLRPAWVLDDADVSQLQQRGGLPVDRFHHYSYVHVQDLARACVAALRRPIAGFEAAYIVADDSSAAEPLGSSLDRFLDERRKALASQIRGYDAGISNGYAASLLGWRPELSWRAAA